MQQSGRVAGEQPLCDQERAEDVGRPAVEPEAIAQARHVGRAAVDHREEVEVHDRRGKGIGGHDRVTGAVDEVGAGGGGLHGGGDAEGTSAARRAACPGGAEDRTAGVISTTGTRATATACRETSAAWKRIILFGSRTDPARQGGDIDLLVEIGPEPAVDTYRLTQRLRLGLEDELGPQRFDLVLDDGTTAGGFVDLARTQGVELWSNS